MRTKPFEPIEDLLATSHPEGVMYHYTSIGSLIKIVTSGEMYATDIRYMNDATEAEHTLTMIRETFQAAGQGGPRELSPGMRGDLRKYPQLDPTYVVCFTKEASLLSQWRGYCPPNRGVSIGFRADDLRDFAVMQGFRVRGCIYDHIRQKQIVWSLVERLQVADTPSPTAWELCSEKEALEAVIKASAILKHPSFSEEQEWRIVSAPSLQAEPPVTVEYREGRSMLIPYRRFQLPTKPGGGLKIERVVVGPTQHYSNAVLSVANFLDSQNSMPAKGVEYCEIPLREA
jgi:hypothetical protein